MEDIVGARTSRVASLAIRLSLDVTPKPSQSLDTLYRESRASLGRLDFLRLVKQTRLAAVQRKGEGYRVISLSRPWLGNNYRRTTSCEMFFPDSPPGTAKCIFPSRRH